MLMGRSELFKKPLTLHCLKKGTNITVNVKRSLLCATRERYNYRIKMAMKEKRRQKKNNQETPGARQQKGVKHQGSGRRKAKATSSYKK